MLAVRCCGVRSSAMASRPASSAASSQAVPWRRICSGVMPGQVIADDQWEVSASLVDSGHAGGGAEERGRALFPARRSARRGPAARRKTSDHLERTWPGPAPGPRWIDPMF